MPLPVTRFTIIISILFLLPWLGLLVLGGYWLWQHGWLYQGVAIISAHFALAYCLLYWRKHAQKQVFIETAERVPNPNWPDNAQLIWPELEEVAQCWKHERDIFSDSKKFLQLTNDVLTMVAKHFHADSKRPILEFPLPYLLKLITLVCNDIQQEVLDKIPGSHAVRVGDFFRARETIVSINKFKSIFNVGNWLFNWPGAAMNKARSLLLNKGVHTVTSEISSHLIDAYIKKLGYYAIELYSGQLTLDDCVPTERMSAASKKDISESLAQKQDVEPLRFLIMGQVSSGKSSLINVLFGEIKCALGILPTTSGITPYLLEREGIQRAIILDSSGYGGLLKEQSPVISKAEWKNIDVVIVVCNATQAARDLDAQKLQDIRQSFLQNYQNQSLPVILAVVTHIDRLRPVREWDPPYQILQPESSKARNIREVCLTLSKELNLPAEMIVPVCLASDKEPYNIEQGLLPLIHEHLDAAQRVRYLRCLRTQQAEGYWHQWREQARKAGQIFLDKL